MVSLWWAEAEKFGVLPLDDRETERAFDWFKSNAPTRYEYLPGMARADRLMIPATNERNFRICAQLESVTQDTRGVVLACGNRFGGYILYCAAGMVVFDYVYTETKSYSLRASIAPGSMAVEIAFEKTGEKSGRFTLKCNGVVSDTGDVPRTWSTYGVTAGLTCGYANVPFNDQCIPPSTFNSTIQLVVVEFDPGTAPQDERFKAILQEE